MNEKHHTDVVNSIELYERVARIEAKVETLENHVNKLEERVKQIDTRLWYILAGVLASLLLQILMRLL